MVYENFLYRVENGIGIITLNRPEKLNTFTPVFKDEFDSVVDDIAKDSSVRVVILTATGRAFCAGGDLDAERDPQTAFELRNDLRKINGTMKKIQEMSKPWIGAINGVAAGAGASLALSCDFIILSENAKFKYTFVDIAIAPDSGGMWVLTKFVGVSKAMEIAMTCRMVKAEEAMACGIALKVVPAEVLMDEAMTFAGVIAEKPPIAVGLVKKLAYKSEEVSIETYCDLEADYVALGIQTNDHKEGVRAFMEKRKPIFTGK